MRINLTSNENNFIIGTGFFIKFRLKDKIRKFLITCNHIINESIVKEKMVIKLYYGKINKEKKLEFKLDRNQRYIKCFDDLIDVIWSKSLKKIILQKKNF